MPADFHAVPGQAAQLRNIHIQFVRKRFFIFRHPVSEKLNARSLIAPPPAPPLQNSFDKHNVGRIVTALRRILGIQRFVSGDGALLSEAADQSKDSLRQLSVSLVEARTK